MKKYHAIIVVNEEKSQTMTIEVTGKNLAQAKAEAAKAGRVICVACDKGSKINF